MNKWFCSILIILLTLTSCQKHEDRSPENPPQDLRWLQRSEKLLILDENDAPLTTAQLLIGIDASSENWLSTNDKGEISLPSTWNTLETITIKAVGYQTLTLMNQSPSMQTLKLKKLQELPRLKLQGDVSGVTTKDKDGYIDFALAMESFSKKDIFKFDINKIISPWTETITVAGYEVPLPQNIFLPKQKENYIITITLQKSNFTLNFPSFGDKKLTTVRGRFPFKKVLSDIQDKKPNYELVNHFEMLSNDDSLISYPNETTRVTLPANTRLFDQSKTAQAPILKSEEVMLGLNCLKEKDIFSPIDIKYFKSQELQNLKALKSDSQYFVGVLKNKSEFEGGTNNTERMSLVILPWTTSTNYQFLALIDNPQLISPQEFNLFPPKKIENLIESGFSAVISEISTVNLSPGSSIDLKTAKWEIYSPTWNNKIKLPDLNFSKDKKYRLEVSFLSQKPDNARNVSFYSVNWSHELQTENATHITKSAVNF